MNPGNLAKPDSGDRTLAAAPWLDRSRLIFAALGSLSARPNLVLSYVGRDTRNGSTVQRIGHTCARLPRRLIFSPGTALFNTGLSVSTFAIGQ